MIQTEKNSSNYIEGENRNSPIVFFDIDGTLTEGFTIFSFAEFATKQGLFDPQAFRQMQNDLDVYSSSNKDDVSYRTFAIELVDHYALGLAARNMKQTEAVSEEFWMRALKGEIPGYEVLAFSQELVKIMNTHGRTIAVTGSPRESVSPLTRHLGFQEIATTTISTENGIYTGTVDRNLALDVAKREVVNISLPKGMDHRTSFAFGDSVHDIPLLEAVGNPYVLGSNPHLQQIGRERNWTVIADGSGVIPHVVSRLSQFS